MSVGIVPLLLAVCAGLFGLAVGSLLLMRNQQRLVKYNARIDGVMQIHRLPLSGNALKQVSLSRREQGATFISRMARLIRYNAANRGIYLMAPPVVLPLALIPSGLFAYAALGFVGPVGWLVAPAMCIWLSRSFYGFFEDRQVAMLFRQFPDTLAMIVRTVRVGLPIVEAIRVASRESPEPTGREFALLVSQTAIGMPLEEALRAMAERNRLPEYRFFATALSLQSQTGGSLTETLDNLADTIRKRVAAKLRGHALASEARMSSYVLGSLPIITGILLAVMNPDYMLVLVNDPGGRNLLLFAGVMLMSGALIMRFMIRRSLT